MPLTITNPSKSALSNQWRERALSWRESGPARDTWAIPGTAITKESKNSLAITNQAKLGNASTWDAYTFSYDASLPDTWDSQAKFIITNESKN